MVNKIEEARQVAEDQAVCFDAGLDVMNANPDL